MTLRSSPSLPLAKAIAVAGAAPSAGRLTVATVLLLLALARTTAAQTPVAAPELVPETTPGGAESAAPAAGTAPAAGPAAVVPTPAVATQPPPPPPAPPGAAPEAAPPPPATAPAQPAPAQEQKVPLRKRIMTWGSVGTTFANGKTYGSANLGVGYLMARGITPNVEASYMFGQSPTIWAARPGLTWYSSLPLLRPYVGVYYTHWFVGGDRPDQDGVGGRLGVSIGRILSLGVTYDRALGCDRNCEIWTPQVSAGLSL